MAVALAGCASDGLTPLGASVQALVQQGESPDVQAEAIPYASLVIRAGQVRGLMVMGASIGSYSFWPSRDGLLLEFQEDGLTALSGMEQELISSRYHTGSATPAEEVVATP
ncbi:hypothetical protein [Halomonas sp. E19]|uniref:hypothetical protein n=1 Tax=Halomonas sp. E19 TaxID=3397247 RepID=UPI004034B7E3